MHVNLAKVEFVTDCNYAIPVLKSVVDLGYSFCKGGIAILNQI